MLNWAMIGRFILFCLNFLRLSLQHLSSLSMFPLQELVVSDRFSQIKLKVGAFFFFVKIFQIIYEIIG